MSKSLFYIFSVAMITLTSFSAVTFAGAIEVQKDPGVTVDWGSGGGGNTAIYIRSDEECPDGVREKTICRSRGDEQCTAQYCN